MHCTRIAFRGYKRLADTACNVDGDIIAVVGLNEAGKSSLLEALVWLTADEAAALPAHALNRSAEVPEDKWVVEAVYALSPEDLALIADLDFETAPSEFTLQRRPDGNEAFGLNQRKRDPAPFDHAVTRLTAASSRLESQIAEHVEASDSDEDSVEHWIATVADALANRGDRWSEEIAGYADELIAWLEEASPTSRTGKARDQQAADALRAVHPLATAQHPHEVARHRLRSRVPKFILFEDSDRTLSTVHVIQEPQHREAAQPSLRNLLAIADLDLDRLWRYIETKDDSNQETYIEEANERLEDFFSQAWNQARVAVRLKVDNRRLEVRLKELGRGGAVTNIEERSDGLRTFIALSAFLAAQHLDVPPILLIDEAETHLHYDAQADLVGVLLKNVEATQVFYTTHSPGCLPTDLGTSIRLLAKDSMQRDRSNLRADFWTNTEPGFAPLLYAMGASAAAFSVCRRAVLSEGPADMILLPTLLRLATGKKDLGYQIAPGLSNAHAYGMQVEEVAAKVVYLADGDQGGDEHVRALREASVRDDRIFQLPTGQALEDLIDRHQYVEVINTLLPAESKVAVEDLDDGQPIAKALQDWGKWASVRIPGHVVVAYALMKQGPNIEMSTTSRKALRRLDDQINAAFDRPAP